MDHALFLISALVWRIVQAYWWIPVLVLGVQGVTMLALRRYSWRLPLFTGAAFAVATLVAAVAIVGGVS